jgi:uncharacterized membrane protein YcfT
MDTGGIKTGVARSTDQKSGRIAWADGVKAFSIVLVVVGHAIGFMIVSDPHAPNGAESLWYAFALAIVPIRVPLFFVISRYFAAQALRRTWRLSLRRRIGDTLWTYGLWLALLIAVFSWVLLFPLSSPDYDWTGYFGQLLMPVNHLWYLWAVVGYFVLPKALRDVPPALTISIAVGLNLISSVNWQPLPENVVRNLFFFLLGASAPTVIEWCGARARPLLVILAIVTYGVIAVVAKTLGLGEVPFVITTMSLLGIFGTIQLIMLATEAPRVANAALWLGSRTQAIYVSHIALLSGISAVIAYGVTQGLDFGTLMYLFPPFAAGLAISVAVASEAFARRIGIYRLFFTGGRSWNHRFIARQDPPPVHHK